MDLTDILGGKRIATNLWCFRTQFFPYFYQVINFITTTRMVTYLVMLYEMQQWNLLRHHTDILLEELWRATNSLSHHSWSPNQNTNWEPPKYKPTSVSTCMPYHNTMVSRSVTKAWLILRLRMEEWPPIWRIAVNILNKQSQTADKGWSSNLGVR